MKHVSLLALLPLAAGCNLFKDAETLDVHKSPTFSVESLASDGLVIGAAISSQTGLLYNEFVATLFGENDTK